MTDRDRLIELIQNSVDGCARHWAEIIADYLLANGVIVPVRCKDCKYWDENVFDPVFRLKYGKCKCEHWENYDSYYETDETDFCSYGELKEREG